jgi:hypothetical protein
LIPTSIQAGSAVCSLDKRSTIPRGTVAGASTAVGPGGTFSSLRKKLGIGE